MTAIRRPHLKIVDRTQPAHAETGARRVLHDERGNAIWSAPINLEDTGDLVLEDELQTRPVPVSEHDPYNRGPSGTRKPRGT